jgi:hypothetical protein
MGQVHRQLPSSLVCKELGEVNISSTPSQVDVVFTVLMTPSGSEAEGWQTGVALDASASMKNCYGRNLRGKLPPDVEEEYRQRGWLTERVEDGKRSKVFAREAYEDAGKRGYFTMSENIIQPQAREFISYLANELDADGGTTVIYWACGDGSGVEEIGDFTADQCATLEIRGPSKTSFGAGTQLLPVMRYFADRFKDATRGMYIVLTDGRIDDLEGVKKLTVQLAKEIAAGKRNSMKYVLIGLGSAIDEGQMEELDDLDTGTDVDLWDHKIAVEMRSVLEIFAEVVSENQIVAPLGAIYDSQGKVVKRFSDGVPALINVSLPAKSPWFDLEVGTVRIRQTLVATP